MKPRRIFSAARLTLPFASALVALLSAQAAYAAALTWDGSSNASWNTIDTNWTGSAWSNVPPDDAIFGATGVGTVTLAEAITAGSLTFDNAGYSIDTATFGLTLNTGITANESATIQSGAVGSIILGAANTWSVADTKTLTVSSAISGTGFGLTKTGLGTLALFGANTYTGATTITTGVVNIQHGTALGTTDSGVTVANGGALQIQGGITVGAEAITINGGGVASPANLGAIRSISGNNTWGGTVTLGSQSRINSDADTLTLSAANSVTAANLTLVVGGAGNTAINGIVALGSGGIIKDGAGTLTLSSANTYTGTTTLTAGTLVTGNTAALGTGAAMALNGGTLRLATDTALSSKNVTLGGNTAITLDRATSGAGFTTTFGALTSTSGSRTLTVTKGGNVTDAATLNFTGTLSVSGQTTTFDVGNGATVRLSGGSAGGAQTITMIKNGTGSLILAGNYATWDAGGATQLNGGTLELRSLMGDATAYRAALTAAAGTTLRLVNDTSTNYLSNFTASGSMGIVADRVTSAATSTTHSLGTLSIGASTLSVSRGASITGAGIGGVTFGNATLSGAATFDTAAGSQLTLGGTTGLAANTLTKSGAGSMTLTGVVSGTQAAGSNAISITGGLLTASNAGNTFSGDIAVSGAGSVFAMAGGTFTTAAPYGRAGGTLYKQLLLTNGGTYRQTGGSFNNNAPDATNTAEGIIFNIGTGGGTLDIASGATLTIDDGTGTGTALTASQLQGSGTLTKTGAGILVLGNSTASNAVFTGQILVNEGILRLGAVTGTGVALGSTGANTVIASGAAFDIGANTGTTSEPVSITGTGIGGTGNVIFTSSTATTPSFNGPITLAGSSTIGSTTAGSMTFGTGATFNLGSNTLTLRNTSTGRIFSDGVISGLGSVVMNSTGTGDYVPRADHTYSGGTTLTAGSIAVDRDSIGSPGSPTSGPFGTGTLNIAGGQMRAGTGSNRTVGNAVTLSGDATFYTVGVEKNLTFTGPVTLSGGNRTLTGNVGTTVAGTATIFSGAIGDGGNNLGLTKAGTGNLTLGGVNTYTGVTASTGGNLLVTGSLANNSGLSITPAAASGAAISFINNDANTPANFNSLALGSATGTSFIGLDLGTLSDSIATTTAATTSNNISFNLNATSGFGAGNYSLISAASGLSGGTYSLSSAPGGFTYGLTNTDSLVQLNAATATAGSRYWRGNLNNSWATFSGVSTTNWATDAAGTTVSASTPGAGDTVFFSATNATGPAITTTLDSNFTINDLQFLSAPTGVTNVMIGAGVIPGSLTIAPTSPATGLTLAQGAGAVTIAAPITLGAAQTWSVDSSIPGAGTASSLTVSGAISGLAANGLTFTTTAGTAPIILSAAGNTYSGGSTVSASTIVQGGVANGFSPNTAWTVNGTLNTGAFNQSTGSLAGGSGTVQNGSATNATLTIGSDNLASATFAGTIQNGSTGALGLTKAGTGTQILSGTNTYTGATTVNGGILHLSGTSGATAVTVNSGTLQFGSATALTSANAVTLAGTGTLDLNGNSVTIGALTSTVATAFITNSSAGTDPSTATTVGTPSGPGVYVDALNTSHDGNVTTAALIQDGSTRKTQIVITNTNDAARFSNAANNFSGGVVLTNSATGTRLSPGTITGTPYGIGPIIIGQAATDKAGIFFATASQTLTNDIVFNTALGTDRVGIRADVAATLSGKITANLAPATFTSNNATAGAFTLTGQVTGASGLVLDITSLSAAATSFNVTLNNGTANPNDYQGDTVINFNAATGKSATLNLGAANQLPNGTGTGNVIINSNGTGIGTLNLAGFSDTINGLSGSGTVDGTSGTPTLTVGDNNATATFSGIIRNTAGTLSLTKTGTGTQTLSGASTFTGQVSANGGLIAFASSPATGGPLGNSTAVSLSGGGLSYTAAGTNALNRSVAIGTAGNNGTLDVTSAAGTLTLGTVTSSGGSLVKTGPGTVSIGGTTSLSGAGVEVNGGKLQASFGTGGVGAITVNSSGSLSFQNSTIEALTLANSGTVLTLQNGARLGFELDGATNDSITVPTGGTLSLAGGYTFDFFGLNAGVTAATYTLLTAPTGSNLNTFTYSLGDAPLGFNYTFLTSDTMVQLQTVAYTPIYWTDSQVTGSWNTINAGPLSNFSTDAAGTVNATVVPTATDTVVFSAASATGPAIATTLDAAFTIDSLQFTNAPAGITSVTVAAGTGGTLTLKPASASGGIAILAGGGNATISAPLTLDNTLSASQAWNVTDAGSTLELSGNVAFGANVNKSGAGAVTLSGANSGAGNFNLNAGTLNLNSAGALGTGALNIAAGTTLNNSSGGAVILSANGAVNVNGDFSFTGTQSLNLGTGAVTLTNNPIVTVAANTLTLGGIVGGTSSLTKAGAGTMTLNGINTFNGGVTLAGGLLNIGNADAQGTGALTSAGGSIDNISGGALTVANALNLSGNMTYVGSANPMTLSASATLATTPAITVSANTLTLSGNHSGAGGLTKAGAGSMVLSGANTYTGDTTVNQGTLNVTGSLTGNGTTAAGSNLFYGTTAGNSVVNVSGDIVNYLKFQGSTVAGANSAYIQTAGNVNFTGTSATQPNNAVASAGYGYMGITGGTLKANGRFSVSNGATSTGVMYVGNSTLDLTAGEWLLLGFNASAAGTDAGRAMLTVDTGATVNRTGATQNIGLNMDRPNGYAVLNLVGGSVLNSTRTISFGNGTAAATNTTGILNLAAGTLELGANMANGFGTATVQSNNNGYLNFAGGTLKSKVALTGAIPLTNAQQTITSTIYGAIDNVGTSHDFAGGLTVDTNNFATTIAAPLVAPPSDGVAQTSLTVNGGTGYIGAPMVQFTGGTLAPGGAPAAGYAVVSGGVVTEIVITSPGSYTAAPTVTLTGGGGTGASVAVGTLAANTSGGLTKTGAGTLTLSGANTYTGATLISAGTLQLGAAGTTGSLSPSSAITNDSVFAVNRTNTATQGTDFGTFAGTGSFTQAGTGTTIITETNTYTTTSITAGTLQIGNGGTTGTLGSGAVTNAGTLAFNRTDTFALAAGNLVTGAGAVTLANTGPVAAAGDNQFNTTGALNFGATAGATAVSSLDLTNGSSTFGNLVVRTNSASNNTITVGAGKTLTFTGSTVANAISVGSATAGGLAGLQVTGSTGTLTVTDSTRNIVVANTDTTGSGASAQMDLSGLGTFNATIANLYVGRPTAVAGDAANGRPLDVLTLAGANTINASGVIAMGGSSQSFAGGGTIKLGTSNIINAASFVAGNGRTNGTMEFNTGLTNPSVTLRGAAGGSSRTNITLGDGNNATGVGNGASGSTAITGAMDFTGGTVNAMIGTLTVGNGAGTASNLRGEGNGRFIIDGASSIVDINTLVIAQDTNSTTAATSEPSATVSTGTVTLKSGNLVVNTAATLANDIDASATANGTQNVAATLNIQGGTATIGSLSTPVNLILGNHVAAGNPGSATATVNLTGGTLNVFGDIKEGTLGSGTITSSLMLNGATLDMKGNNLGVSGAEIDTLTFASGTLKDVAQINNGGAITKTTAGTLIMAGTNTYTGATTVSAGTLLVNGSTAAGSAVTVDAAATLGGTGTISGAVTVTGVLAPGNSIESLKIGSLIMAAGSKYVYEASDNSATGADLIGVAGALSLTDVTLDLTNANLNAGTWNLDDKLTLISYGGTAVTSGFTGYIDDSDYTFGSNIWRIDYNDDTAGGNYIADLNGGTRFVTLTVVPEPSTALLALFGSLALLRRRR